MSHLIATRAQPSKPGLRFGLSAAFDGFAYLVRTPRIWPYAALPTLLLCACIALFGWLTFSAFTRLFGLGPSASSKGAFLIGAARILSGLGAALIGSVLALIVTPPLSGPALERIVRARERELGIPERPPVGMLQSLLCGLRAQAAAALFTWPLLLVLALVDFVVPGAALITFPAKFVVTALGLAWNLFDYPLTLRGVPVRERLRLVMRHKRVCLGFGAGFAVIFLLPCCGVLLLPIGAAAATRTVWRLLELDSGACPSLRL